MKDLGHAAARRVGLCVLAVFATMLVASSGQAGDRVAAQSLKPLEFFLGNWTCDGTDHATAKMPEHPFIGRFDVAPVLDGRWIKVAYDEETSESHPAARRNTEFWGTTADGSGFVSTFFNNAGLSGTLASGGWSEASLHWEGEVTMPAGPAPFRAVIEKTGPDAFTLSPSLQVPDGTWQAIATLDCHLDG